ncbi:MAG: polyprenol monophosphomannose synthase [Planctomycetota bacterium]
MLETRNSRLRLLVALATYNEIETLPSLVEEIHGRLPDAHVLVVDDNSPDGTGQWCENSARVHDWFFHFPRPGKLGLGTALEAALKFGVDRAYSHVITLDADWSHPPDALPEMVEAAAGADVVIGSRYCPGGSITGWPLRRRIASRVMNRVTRLLVGLPLNDCTGNCRLYSTAQLARLDWESLEAEGYAYLEEILFALQLQGATFAEVPITFTDRRAGASKINLSEVTGAAKVLMRLALRRLW